MMKALKATASFIGKWTGLNMAGRALKKVGKKLKGSAEWTAALLHGKFEPEASDELDTAEPEMMPFEDFDFNAALDTYEKKKEAEPYLVLKFANAPSFAEGIEFTQRMPRKTRDWCLAMGQDEGARLALRNYAVQDIAAHIRGERTIDGVPRLEANMFGVGNKGRDNGKTFGQRSKPNMGMEFANPASRAIAAANGEKIGRQAEWGASAGGWKPDEGAQWQKPQQAPQSRAERAAEWERQNGQTATVSKAQQIEEQKRRAA